MDPISQNNFLLFREGAFCAVNIPLVVSWLRKKIQLIIPGAVEKQVNLFIVIRF